MLARSWCEESNTANATSAGRDSIACRPKRAPPTCEADARVAHHAFRRPTSNVDTQRSVVRTPEADVDQCCGLFDASRCAARAPSLGFYAVRCAVDTLQLA